jgi:hypothetical protein
MRSKQPIKNLTPEQEEWLAEQQRKQKERKMIQDAISDAGEIYNLRFRGAMQRQEKKP